MSKVKGEFLISVDFFFKDQIYIYIFLDSKYGLFLLLSNRTHLITFFFIQQVLSSHPFYPHQCIHVNPNLPVHPTLLSFPPWYPYICSLCLCLYFCFVNKIVYASFFRFHMYALIYDICFSLSDLLHSV